MTDEKDMSMDNEVSSVEKRAEALLSEFVLDNHADGSHRRKVDFSWSSSGRALP